MSGNNKDDNDDFYPKKDPVLMSSFDNDEEEPDYDYLGLSYHEEFDQDDDTCCKGKKSKHPHENQQKKEKEEHVTEYILGTLLVRMVQARDLSFPSSYSHGHVNSGNSNNNAGLVGHLLDTTANVSASLLFGNNHQKDNRRGKVHMNPHGSMHFMGQTQRTSQLYETKHPVWPRGEECYFDVLQPMLANAANQEEGQDHDEEEHENQQDLKKEEREGVKDTPLPCAPPMLTLWLMHRDATKEVDSHVASLSKKSASTYPYKPTASQSSYASASNVLLGMARINLRPLLTGASQVVDQWLPLLLPNHNKNQSYKLSSNNTMTGQVRIVCEYLPTDPPPRPGDECYLTGYCRPNHIFPIPSTSHSQPNTDTSHDQTNSKPSKPQRFVVSNILHPHSSSTTNSTIVLSYTTPENWITTFAVHPSMLLTTHRHQAALEVYQEEFATRTHRLAQSPLVDTVAEVVTTRVPQEGLIHVAGDVIKEGWGLVGRWMGGGVEQVVQDVVFATNWDGKVGTLNHANRNDATFSGENETNGLDSEQESELDLKPAAKAQRESPQSTESLLPPPPPGMPACPITGQPMHHPVVAADGHTYEKSAIETWLQRSMVSPLTGQVLGHKELVPNYLLLSSLAAGAGIGASASATATASASASVGGDGITEGGGAAFATASSAPVATAPEEEVGDGIPGQRHRLPSLEDVPPLLQQEEVQPVAVTAVDSTGPQPRLDACSRLALTPFPPPQNL